MPQRETTGQAQAAMMANQAADRLEVIAGKLRAGDPTYVSGTELLDNEKNRQRIFRTRIWVDGELLIHIDEFTSLLKAGART